jgi:hypothetical protein
VKGLSGGRKALAVAGFVVLGLSPSFEDWKQSPEDRGKMVAFYAVAVALIWCGIFDG